MKKCIGVMLCICFLAGLVSGCGTKTDTVTESNNLTEKDKAATMENGGELEATDAAVLGSAQPQVTEESSGEIVSSGEESGWQPWQQAYLAKAEEIETKYGFPMEYDLIYLDGDDIPEFVAGPTGYWFILCTWKNGKVYELIDYAPYGTHGRMYCYEPYQGIIEESVYDMIMGEKESDSYTIFYTIYHTVTENMEIMEQYELIEEWRETGSTYYYQDAPWTESREIEVEEFSSYKKENLPEIYGRFDLEVLRYLLENAADSSAHSLGYEDMTGEAVRSLLVTETYYDGEGEVISQSQITYEYDSDGNQIRVLLDHEDRFWTYEYDDSGNLIEEVCYENGVIISYVKYEYDEDGLKIKSLVYFGDERAKMASVYQYNYYGNLTMETTYSYYREVVNKTSCLYEYDRGGNLIRRTFSKEDIFHGTEEYMYDAVGNLFKEVSYDSEGNVFWLCVYDDSGNLIKEESYDAEGNAFWFYGYDYDKNGNMIEETTLSYIKKYEYDEQNNKTKEIYYPTDGDIANYVEWTYEWL